MSRVQIVKMEPGKTRWEFIAHGAPYERGEADEWAERLKVRGCKVRFLPIGKES